MGHKLLDCGGLIVPESRLSLRRPRELVAALRGPGASFAALVECRSSAGAETVILEVEVERPQVLANDVQRIERLAAVFSREDLTCPDVLALRPDFPATVHLNQRFEELPRSLCLYDRPWSEERVTWTAPRFIERVRWWLRETARGSLHAEDQALEPFLLSSGKWLVLPASKKSKVEPDWFAVTLPGGKDGNVFVATESGEDDRRSPGSQWVVLRFVTPTRQHAVLPRVPQTLADLASLLRFGEFDVVESIRRRLRDWPEARLSDGPVILMLELPKTRRDGGDVEVVERAAFFATKTVLELGVAVGLWAVQDGKRAALLRMDPDRDGRDVSTQVVNVCDSFTREAGARLNGLNGEEGLKILAVGAGALGSQVAMNMARAGWGKWTIVDNDDLLPHNLARHAMDGRLVGWPKAEALAFGMNCIFQDTSTATSVTENVLRPASDGEKLEESLRSAEIILDLSASVAVARHLGSIDGSPGRRLSLFLSPAGKDLVLLGEDAKRRITIDHLEMNYYSALAVEECLSGHLDVGAAHLRYGLSCRDISSRIPQDMVGTFAGIGAKAIRQTVAAEGASIRIWRSDSESLGVLPISIEPELFFTQTFSDWKLIVSPRLLRTVATLRKKRLPSETGGVLIGGIDHDRKIVYLLVALSSPPDSDEWPTHYIRGCESLRERVKEIESRTAGNLGYVGEWHSHPEHSQTVPSAADEKVFAWVSDHTLAEGRPPVLMIAGSKGRVRLVVGVGEGMVIGDELWVEETGSSSLTSADASFGEV